MNTTKLFDALRKMASTLSQQQVDSVNAILEACNKHSIVTSQQVSYVIATAYHESRLKPISEIGLGKGHPYGELINGKAYYGRGFVQLTWIGNYKEFGSLLGIDLVGKPELTLQTDYAAEIIALGMAKGLFTGVSLNHYFNPTITDPLHARKIINGMDCAALIKGYYDHILEGILAN